MRPSPLHFLLLVGLPLSLGVAAPTAEAAEAKALKKLERRLAKGDSELVFRTAEALDELGLEVADAIPVLAATMTDPKARTRARKTAVEMAVKLGEMGEGAPLVPALAEAIFDPDGFVSADALRALQRIGEPAAPAMPALMKLMRTDSRGVRSPIQSIGEAAIPYLLEGLGSDLPEVRAICAGALYNHGRHAEIHGPVITAFDDPVVEVRLQALETGRYLRPTSPQLLDALEKQLADAEPAVVLAAVKALERHDAGAKAEAVRPLLQHADAEVRSAASKALGRMSAGGAPIQGESRKDLAGNLADPDLDVRFQAAVALAASAPDTPGLVAPLREGLERANAGRLMEAITALGQLGPRARAAAPDLLQVIRLYSSAELIQSRAAQSLGAMGPMPEHAAAVTALLPGAGGHLQVWLLYAVSALDPSREDGVAGLVQRLRNSDSVVLQNAVHALGLLGPRARAALPELRRLLGSDDPSLKALAEWAIGQVDTRQV